MSQLILLLQGDAKAELCDYLVEKGIDLLIVGYSAANRFKKAFAGGSLSTHMMQHAQCPVVVIPLKSMSWEDQDTLGQLPEHRQSLGGESIKLYKRLITMLCATLSGSSIVNDVSPKVGSYKK